MLISSVSVKKLKCPEEAITVNISVKREKNEIIK